MSYPPATLASAIAANNLLRYLLVSVFPLFTVQMYPKLHIEWATSLFAFISLAMVPVPFLFKEFGAKLRTKSKFGYAALFESLFEQKAFQQLAIQEAASQEPPNDENSDTANGFDVSHTA
ncbi:uncharacterized protein PRCAT00001444001 [Priceomyces carsonii]|uniref:uncharacterized protein n=1 Tax=Priceomyces carsonii TaxID=28549 RepID=UPI002ED9529C|nr:unnamed protein product [Priceomyces carsonii]